MKIISMLTLVVIVTAQFSCSTSNVVSRKLIVAETAVRFPKEPRRITSQRDKSSLGALVGAATGLSYLDKPDVHKVDVNAHIPERRKTLKGDPSKVSPTLKKVVSLQKPSIPVVVDEVSKLVAQYDTYPGSERGLFWWKRRWEERSTYEFNLARPLDRDDVVLLEIIARSESRPNEKFPWRPCDSEFLEDRVDALLAKIQNLIEQ